MCMQSRPCGAALRTAKQGDWLPPHKWACVFPALLIFHFLFCIADIFCRTKVTESPNMTIMTGVEAALVSV